MCGNSTEIPLYHFYSQLCVCVFVRPVVSIVCLVVHMSDVRRQSIVDFCTNAARTDASDGIVLNSTVSSAFRGSSVRQTDRQTDTRCHTTPLLAHTHTHTHVEHIKHTDKPMNQDPANVNRQQSTAVQSRLLLS